ncbi:glycerol-3-phosphate dehydrogenase/oxidase [Rhizobium puerariae]|uniref:Glycerol-3-phosphate dehydrogenase/oxidase n=1 Tax=Rhizobium puerariae TaxID=1585791 RepID=A0ABV6AGL3_9HYPH
MNIREESLRRLASGMPVDVLVIGGGVNGVAVLRDLALNDVPAVLLDRADFCKGASGASSRMAHGGLRYLENREFKLVAESTRERNLLLKYAPHVTSPLEIAVPLTNLLGGLTGSIRRFLGFSSKDTRLSAAALQGALFLYELLGRVEKVLPSHDITLSKSRFPAALSSRYKALIRYYDARICNPEALVLEMLEGALASSRNAACLNHITWSQGIDGGITVVDPAKGNAYTLRPKLIVNAAGAWVDAVNADLGLSTAYIRPVKGAHLLLRHDALFERMAGRAFYFDDGTGRMVISYPLDGTVLLGTTEIPVGDPDDNIVAPSEIEYLTQAISRLFDDITVTEDHIVAVTSGIRPLQAGGHESANRANRDHLIAEDTLPRGGISVLSLVGGKWTTFRAFSEQATDRVLQRLSRHRKVDTRRRFYPGADQLAAVRVRLKARADIPSDRADVLVRRYGALAGAVADFCSGGTDAPLGSLPDHTRREIVWLIEQRAALFLDDLILRRMQVVAEGRCTPAAVGELGRILAETRGKDEEWMRAQVSFCLGLQTVIFAPAPAREVRHA